MVSLGAKSALASEKAGNGTYTVWWSSVNGANSYNLYFKESGEKMYTHAVAGLPSNASSYTIQYLKSNVTYVYTIAAVDNGGKEFWWSTPKSFWGNGMSQTWTASTTTPASPSSPKTPVLGMTSATATWMWQSKAQYYNVYYREAGQKTYAYSVPNVPSNGTSVKINYLRNGVGYYYNVAAFYDGMEHWLGEKTLTWPVEVVTLDKTTMTPEPTTTLTPTTMDNTGTLDPLGMQPTAVPTMGYATSTPSATNY